MNYMDWLFGTQEDKKKIVGPLYGQLTFEAVPDTRKIIVISKIPAAYDVVEELIRELDSMETAELPMVITLNYADAEDLCEQLNAILNEPGTPATVRRSEQGLSAYSTEEGASIEEGDTSPGEMTMWWSRTRGRVDEERPISNLIGKIRFIPVHRSKALLVLSPREYQEGIREIIKELDQPGRQVMIKAVIVQVDHSAMTSLGVKLSSAENVLAVGENAVTAWADLSLLETHGSLTLEAGTNVNALVDFLIKETNGRVLNQPTLFTKDNKEAVFFKGRRVPFIQSAQTSEEGRGVTTSYTYENVGVTLRVRPNITPEKDVDVTINLIIGQVEQERIGEQVVTSELNTSTNLIVEDGQTIMLGGILNQDEGQIEQKLPLLGDVPLMGPLFRHYDTVETNNELIVFITPYVIDEQSSPETIEELEKAETKLESVLKELNNNIENM
jgi:general secretion pathway protein D